MTSNTTISSCTVLPLSVVVSWAGDRVNAVTPPNRSIKCSRTAVYFSGPSGRPPLSLSGRSSSARCIGRSSSEAKHAGKEKQRDRDRGRKQQ
jgi:hypothetical protein